MPAGKRLFDRAAANVQHVDDPYEKRRMREQMLFMKRIPIAALASIISSWLYFGYACKCLLQAQADGLSGVRLETALLILRHAARFRQSVLAPL